MEKTLSLSFYDKRDDVRDVEPRYVRFKVSDNILLTEEDEYDKLSGDWDGWYGFDGKHRGP